MKNVLAYYFYQQQNNLYPVPQEAVDAACQHARARFPEESVGCVIAGMYYPLTNVHANPTEFFEVHPVEWMGLVEAHGEIQAVIHSHTQNQQHASKADMEAQMAFKVPFGIIAMDHHNVTDVLFFGDRMPPAPYLGRPFKDGIYDCFALCRDWYLNELGISIPNYPRSPLWWEDKEHPDLITPNFIKEGFEEIEFSQLRPGDAIVGSIYSEDRINHCGIHLGDGLILHHLYGSPSNPRVSTTDVLYSWRRMVRKCLRHKDVRQVPLRGSHG